MKNNSSKPSGSNKSGEIPKKSSSGTKKSRGGSSSSGSGMTSADLPHSYGVKTPTPNPTYTEGKLTHEGARKLPTFTSEQLHEQGKDTTLNKMYDNAVKQNPAKKGSEKWDKFKVPKIKNK